MMRAIRLFSYWHGQTYGIALITFEIGKHILSGIRFLQDASFYIVNVNLTLSHTPIA